MVEDQPKLGRNLVDMGSCGMVLEVGRCVFDWLYDFEVPERVDSEAGRKQSKL
jgi:hypothetical protein